MKCKSIYMTLEENVVKFDQSPKSLEKSFTRLVCNKILKFI